MVKFLFLMVSFFTCFSCQFPPTKESIAGKYTVSATLINKEEIKQKVQSDVSKAKEEIKQSIADAKKELNEVDFSDIDTSTTEGRMEYYSKKAASEISKSVLEMESGLSGIMDGIATLGTSPIEALESLLKNSNFNVELQEDGDVKLSGLLNMAVSNLQWDIDGDDIVVNQDGKEKGRTTITKRDENGFECIYQKWKVRFDRKN